MKPACRREGEEVPAFGAQEPGITYRFRPGAYVLILRPSGAGAELAAVRTSEGLFLPGGGIEPGESLEAAAVREAREECGFRIALAGLVGVADEFVFAADEGVHYRKRCSFFRARLEGSGDRPEAGHELIWLPAPHWPARLTLGSERWAAQRVIGDESA